ncbi:hypothetical protein PK28_17935 (plasmid) [Hymenobacter sp. DG25B]|nr:hypothetical protein PK28_17935 [Hymenobacter sp. DG25B]
MKFAGDTGVVAIAKLQVYLVLFLFGLPPVGVLGRLWTHRQMHLTRSNRLDVVLLLNLYSG